MNPDTNVPSVIPTSPTSSLPAQPADHPDVVKEMAANAAADNTVAENATADNLRLSNMSSAMSARTNRPQRRTENPLPAQAAAVNAAAAQLSEQTRIEKEDAAKRAERFQRDVKREPKAKKNKAVKNAKKAKR